MGNCIFCGKEINNAGSLGKHQKGCLLNPDRIIYESNFKKYNSDVKIGVQTKKYLNHYVKAAELGLDKPIISDETRSKIGEASRNRVYTTEDRERISKRMKEVVLQYPESYSCSNVCGRTKLIEYNGFWLNGKWELDVAKWLDANNIIWTNKITGFNYEWEGSTHIYFPDFYLQELDLYIEVKGYERDRDRCKWKQFPHKLVILKSNEIKLIRKNEFDIIKSF